MRTLTVDLGDRQYPVYLGQDILSTFGEVYLSHGLPRITAVVTDRTVASLYLRELSGVLAHQGISTHPVIMPSGEKQKSLARTNTIITQFLEAGLTRAGSVIALGGGVVGDVAGFAAAIYRRGIPIVQVPTTLLAQVESSIGGKVGVNHRTGKNAFGAFHQPGLVFSHIKFLTSLPDREIVCGLGEMLKYALFDEHLFKFFETNLDAIRARDLDVLEESIYRCNDLKVRLVADDERELKPDGGGRAILNIGHTLGHALENCSHYRLHHGEAVLVGLRWELALALRLGLLGRDQYGRISALLGRVDFSPSLQNITVDELMAAIYGKNNRARFILPKKIGEFATVDDIPPSEVKTLLLQEKK